MLWDAVSDPETGLDTVTEYQIFWDNGSGGVDWVSLHAEYAGSFTFEHLIDTGIIRSHTYKFYYKAVNQHGVGFQSSTSTIEASKRPM